MSLIDQAVRTTVHRVAADEAASDAKLDQLLAGLGALTTTVGTFAKRLDAVEAEVKKPDAETPPAANSSGDIGAKLDAISEHITGLHTKHDAMKATCDGLSAKQDALCSRMDAMEEASKKEPAAEPEPAPPAIDAVTTEPTVATADSAAEKKLDAATAEIAGLKNILADMNKRLPAEIPADQKPHFTAAQAKWEKVAQLFGDSEGAPRAMNGESLPDYNRRLASKYKSHSKAWKEADLDKMPDAVLDTVITQIHADAMTAAASPAPTADGVLTQREFTDPMSGRKTRKFYGDISVMLDISRNPRQFVTGFPALTARH